MGQSRAWSTLIGGAFVAVVACGPADDPMLQEGNGADALSPAFSSRESLGGTPQGSLSPQRQIRAGCYDGTYAETPPDAAAAVDDLALAYDPAAAVDFAIAALGRRYPFGQGLVKGAKDEPRCRDALATLGQGADADLLGLSQLVHTCGNAFDGKKIPRGIYDSAFQVTDGVAIVCQGGFGETLGSDPNAVFGRGLLLNDRHQQRLPPCGATPDGTPCDLYAAEALGEALGPQGFNTLLEETLQNVNGLATSFAFRERMPAGRRTSARDGVLNWLWYVERYLQMARLEHPGDYAVMAGSPCWRKAILTTWGRAQLYLELTEELPALGLYAERLRLLVEDPELLAEIQLLREREQCVAR